MKSKVDMGFLPEAVRKIGLIERFEAAGLVHFATGKTREMFELPDEPDMLLIYATDRISIFDIVLNALIDFKGYVLTATTVFWLKVLDLGVSNHLIAYGAEIDDFLPEILQEDDDLQKRCLLVEKAVVFKTEAIVRGRLTGSGLKDYLETGIVCGHKLPEGLHDGSLLPEVLFTPSTKAESGKKDKNISFEEMVKIIGDRKSAEIIRDKALELFSLANEIAVPAGVVIADTKFEFGLVKGQVNRTPQVVIVDEILTPDSSRFWPWQEEYSSAPESFDKQGVRDWGKSVGIKKDPTIIPPPKVLSAATGKYLEISQRLTGMSLQEFWKEAMGIE